MSDSVRPHRRQPTRLPHPWDSPSKNTGVGCHFLLQCMKVKSESEVVQQCPIPSIPIDCSPPGSSIHGIFQARILEWGPSAFSVVCSTPVYFLFLHHLLPSSTRSISAQVYLSFFFFFFSFSLNYHSEVQSQDFLIYISTPFFPFSLTLPKWYTAWICHPSCNLSRVETSPLNTRIVQSSQFSWWCSNSYNELNHHHGTCSELRTSLCFICFIYDLWTINYWFF